jgi:glycosyltransferase involved in cell wall biosynthesis
VSTPDVHPGRRVEQADGQPEVSVIVPAFNPGPLLTVQLDALSRQQIAARWEVVVVDNGSNDGSLEAVADYRDVLDIRVEATPVAKRGPSAARNHGAQVARGAWIAFCDADDVVAASWLSDLFSARKLTAVVSGSLEVGLLNPPEVVRARGGASVEPALMTGPCGFLPFVATCNMMMSRSAFVAIGGFDESMPYNEDVDFSWRAQLAGLTLETSPAVVHYRHRATVRDVYRRMSNYGEGDALLYRDYRQYGARRREVRQVARSLFWLASRAPFAGVNLTRRHVWFQSWGAQVGRIRGSIRYRVLYP